MALPLHTFDPLDDSSGAALSEWFEDHHHLLSYSAELIIRESISTCAPVRPPSDKGVYFLIDKGFIAYVGRSSNIYRRLTEHEATSKRFDRYWCFGGVPYDWLPQVEAYYIHRLKPYLNRYSGGCDPALHAIEKRYRALWKSETV